MSELPSHPWIDTTQAPLLIVSFPASATDDEVRTFNLTVERLYRVLHTKMSWLIDCSQVRSVTAQQRKLFAEHQLEIADTAQRYNAGAGFVITNPIVRGALMAIMWLSPLKYPHEVFGDRHAAFEYCRKRLREA